MSNQVLNLSKGEAILDLTKKSGAPLKKVVLELFWKPDGLKKPFDLDASALLANADLSNPRDYGSMVSTNHVCFYNQPVTPYIKHLKGDNQNGESAEGEADEIMELDLEGAASVANVLPTFITISKWKERNQTFEDVTDPHVVVRDGETGDILAKADLRSMEHGSTGAIFVVFKKQANGAWSLENVSKGFPGKDLGDFLGLYNVQTQYK